MTSKNAPLRTLFLVGDDELGPAVQEFAHKESLTGKTTGRFVDFGDRTLYFKGGHLRGKHRWRHAVRRALLRRPFPRLTEFENLLWLRRNGFDAPVPVVAGLLHFGLNDDYQFLATERVPEAKTLAEVLPVAETEARLTLTRTLASDVARMHALGFVHRDLYPRNIMVSGTPEAPRIHYLDAWRGGPRIQSRGHRYDLECLAGGLRELAGGEISDAFLQAYLLIEPAVGVSSTEAQ